MRTARALIAATAMGLPGLGACTPGMPVGDLDETTFAVFEDPASDFSTMDVRDVDGEIVRFDATRSRLIWVSDALSFDGYDVDGNLLAGGFFTVRFGTEDGVRRAYFTETDPPTICDIEAPGGMLRITSTQVTVPQE